MIIDFFGSLKDNLIKKVKNPFLGAFGIVFVLKNWQLFYSLLYFDAGETRLSRIEIIESYLSSHGGAWGIFGVAVGCTLIVLVLTYSLSLIGTYIANFSDTIAIPWVVKLATRGTKIVTKETYDKLDLRCKKIEDDIKKEREKRIQADIDREKAEKELLEYKAANQPRNPLAMTSIETAIETKKQETEKQENNIESKIIEKIIKDGWSDKFTELITLIAKQSARPDENEVCSDLTNFLIQHAIIEIRGDDFDNKPCYFFTDYGEKIKKEFADKLLENE